MLDRLGIPYSVHRYDHDPRRGAYGLEASDALGVEPERVFKTLIADVDGKLTVGVVPVDCQLDLKALAAAGGWRRRGRHLPAGRRPGLRPCRRR
jgi:Cys-tRNA(Pro)/Cys-tRNA(Cys) deacylase